MQETRGEAGGTPGGIRVLILGLGNRLLTDDGIGSCFSEVLSTFNLPNSVEVIDGGLGGLNLIDYIEGRDVVFLVDSLTPEEGEPGEVKLFKVNPEAVNPEEALRSLVEAGSHGVVPELLIAAAEALGYLPERTYVLGIVPCLIDLGDKITSKAVAGCLKALKLLKSQLEGLGISLDVDFHLFKERLKGVCGGVEVNCTSGH